jgi:LysR family hydrogen peroxide-inducible transcriptional activator
MNIRDFEYLIAVHELKSFTGAAEKCFVSQPALSQQIKKIEEQIGFSIFERGGKEIITTAKGQKTIKYAQEILILSKKIKDLKNDKRKIQIGLIPTICPYLLPKIVDQLHSKFPLTNFYFLELKTEELIDKLKSGEIDMGIFAYFENLIDAKLDYLKLYDEEFLLTLPKNATLTVADFPKIIQSKRLILLEEGNCMSDNIKEICSIHSNNSFNEFYATNIETVKNMVRINNGIALLPKLSLENKKNLKTLSFAPKKFREVGMIVRKTHDEKDLIKKIGSAIKNMFL